MNVRCTLAIATISLSVNAYAYDTGSFPEPALAGFHLERVKHLDKDAEADGEQETAIEILKGADNSYLMRYTTNGVTWAWGFMGDFDAGPDNTELNYAIRDSDGDGQFDQRYDGAEEFFVPNWVYEIQGT